MLEILSEFRKALDEIMLQCMHDRIAIYGYDTYTGRFLKWYASYYHGIEVDWRISEDMSVGKGYEREVFCPSVFDFGYKDVKNATLWLAQPLTGNLSTRLSSWGVTRYFDFYKVIYGEDISVVQNENADAFRRKKRDYVIFSSWSGSNGNMGAISWFPLPRMILRS